MSIKQVVEKKEKSMIELIIIVAVIAILMGSFINQFFKQQQQITDTGFESLAHKFSSKVQVVHGQWFMDKQPNVVVLSSFNSEKKELVSVNDFGWIDSDNQGANCQQIWQVAMDMPMNFMQKPVVALELVQDTKQGRTCRYQLAEGLYFDYNTRTGKVQLTGK